MPFYRRKIVIIPLVVIASFIAWLSYLWAVENHRPSQKQTQILTDIANKAYAIILENDLNSIQINNGSVWPESLQDDNFESLFFDIERANSNIEHVLFSYLCEDKCYFTAYYYIDKPSPKTIGPYRYLQYNPDGHLKQTLSSNYRKNSLTEHIQYNRLGWSEEFVPSISAALKEDSGNVYFFCEPLEQEHWHFCRGQFG